jgi:NADH-quinone oxidoreductase subunit J
MSFEQATRAKKFPGAAAVRLFLLLLAAVVLFTGLALGSAAPAAAQAPPADAPTVITGREPPRSATPAGKESGTRDAVNQPPRNKRGGPIAFAFWGFAFLAVAGSLFVVTRRNLITAVMGMVGTFFAIAALYMLLYASFVAIIQMLVYAGAIMVLFVFVIMILNKPEDEPYGGPGKLGKLIAGLGVGYLLFRIGSVLIDVQPSSPAAMLEPPVTAQGYQWGSTAAVGWSLFNEYLFPFEAVSILLLVAVVGAIAIARPLKDDVVESLGGDEPAGTPAGGHS